MLAGLGVGYAAKVQGPLGGLPGGPDPSKVDRLDILLWGSWGVTGVDVVPPAALFSPWVSAEDMQCRPVRRYRFPLVISQFSMTGRYCHSDNFPGDWVTYHHPCDTGTAAVPHGRSGL